MTTIVKIVSRIIKEQTTQTQYVWVVRYRQLIYSLPTTDIFITHN